MCLRGAKFAKFAGSGKAGNAAEGSQYSAAAARRASYRNWNSKTSPKSSKNTGMRSGSGSSDCLSCQGQHRTRHNKRHQNQAPSNTSRLCCTCPLPFSATACSSASGSSMSGGTTTSIAPSNPTLLTKRNCPIPVQVLDRHAVPEAVLYSVLPSNPDEAMPAQTIWRL